jgi:hypothetical protein
MSGDNAERRETNGKSCEGKLHARFDEGSLETHNKMGARVSLSNIVWIRRIWIGLLLLVTIISGYGGHCKSPTFHAGGGLTSGSSGTPPNAPSNLTATIIENVFVDLKWTDHSNNEFGFEIEREVTLIGPPNPPAPTYTQLHTVGQDITSYIDEDTQRSTITPPCTYRYTYRVRAYNSHGYSAYSNEASAETMTTY